MIVQELVGRLTSLDPQASETLKVVAYFDALIAGDVGVETIVRGAAALSGVVAGLRHGGTIIRVAPDGDRADDASEPDAVWPSIAAVDGDAVWIERAETAHVNDAMVLERFALAIAISRARRRIAPDDSVHVLISGTKPADMRAAASARLALPERVRAVASLAGDEPAVAGFSTVVATAHGVLRATIITDRALKAHDAAGWGTWGTPDQLPQSWDAAVFAWRLGRSRSSGVDAEDLGVLGAAAMALEGTPQADVDALQRLDERSLSVLAALVEAESIRAAASALGMHHSTVQARHDSLTRELGYDPRSAVGRARFEVADMLRRIG